VSAPNREVDEPATQSLVACESFCEPLRDGGWCVYSVVSFL
jgi:hypothetical protein